MSALDDLKDRIDSAIYTNTEQNITGDGLQTVLDDMVDTMGVSVSQNSETGHTDITIGDTTTPVPSVEEVNRENVSNLLIGGVLVKQNNIEKLNLNSEWDKPMFVKFDKQGFVNGIAAKLKSATDVDIIKINSSSKSYEVIKTIPANQCIGEWKIIIFDTPIYLEASYEIGTLQGLTYGVNSGDYPVYYKAGSSWGSGDTTISANIMYLSPSIANYKKDAILGGFEQMFLDYNNNILAQIFCGYQFMTTINPSSSPYQYDGALGANVYYIPIATGTYSNFNNIEIKEGEYAIIIKNVGASSYAKVVLYKNLSKIANLSFFQKQYGTYRKGKYTLTQNASNHPIFSITEPFVIKYLLRDNNTFLDISIPQGTFDLLDSTNYNDASKVWNGSSTQVFDVLHTSNALKLYSLNEVVDAIYEGNYNTRVPICRVLLSTDGCYIIDEYIKTFYNSEVVVSSDIVEKRSFASRTELVADAITVNVGLINSDGSIDDTGTSFKYTNLIEIPNGVKYILFSPDGAKCPNYVNCYTNNDYTGFIGRSDAMTYQSLAFGDYYLDAMELPDGTRYIAYLAGSQGTQKVSSTPKIYGSLDCASGFYVKDKFISVSSEEGQGEPNTTDHFTIQVNCHPVLQGSSDAITLQDEQDIYTDYAMIMLPSTYSKSGNPVPLVIGCHGAGGDVSINDSQVERSVLYQYLVANGYAVCDCNGFPEEWCQEVGVSKINNIGSPIAMECYIKMYQYIIKHYNVSHRVLLCGGSMGGITATNIALSGAIPVIAQGINCPVLDTYNEIFLRPWSDGLPKTAMGVVYDFDVDGSGNYIYDENKLRGFNPMVNGMHSYTNNGVRVTSVGTYDFTTHKLNGEDVIEYRVHPCPLKIWHCENDNVVSYQCSQRFVTAIRNGGGNAVLRSIITGYHGPLDVGEVLENPSGNTSYRGTTLEIKPIVEEIFMFFERYAEK